MYVFPSHFAKAYHEIKRTSLSHSTCKLIIFVSCLDIDSLCSAKILSNIFKKELIQYQLIPVVGYSDLKLHFQKLDYDITNVILIGCGAMLDVETFLEIDAQEYMIDKPGSDSLVNDKIMDQIQRLRRKVFIIDGHRPWNLDNVFGSSTVICLDDGFIDANLEGERTAYEKLIDYEEGDEEGEEGESEESEESEEEEDEEDENEENEEEENPSDEETITRKRKRQEKSAKSLRKQRRKEINTYEDIIETYYSQGTTITTSTTGTIYALLSSIGETSIENLWLSIIGTSSLDNHYPEVYDKFQPLFKDEVIRLNPSNHTSEKTADSTVLTIDKDYHLFLLRHWTLYNSFFYSSHVNSKLNLWTEDGKKRLHKLFAKMGVSLAIAQQKWLYMDISVKRKLPSIFNKYLPLYGLEGIVREGFIRTFGFTGQLSAMECVESLTALLESDKRIFYDNDDDSNGGINNGGISNGNGEPEPEEEGEVEEQERINSTISKREKIWVNNFWSSWDALNMNVVNTKTNNSSSVSSFKKSKGLDLLLQGLESAKKIQQIVFRTGTSLLERKLIKNLRLYRLCVLNDGSIPNLNIFNNPLILSKLGNWLLENITELEFMNNSNTLKPLVVASLDITSDTYLVIGLAPKYPRGMNNSAKAKLFQQKKKHQQEEEEEEKQEEKQDTESTSPSNGDSQATITTRLNTFSVAFQQVANMSGAKVRIDSFDSSVIEIRKDDLSPFLEKLTLSGLV